MEKQKSQVEDLTSDPLWPTHLHQISSDAAWHTYLPKNLTSYVNAPLERIPPHFESFVRRLGQHYKSESELREKILCQRAKDWPLKKQTTFVLGQFPAISGHSYANYINSFHKI